MNGTRFEQKSFTVPASSATSPADCQHGWVRKGRCVLCGERGVRPPPIAEPPTVPECAQGWSA